MKECSYNDKIQKDHGYGAIPCEEAHDDRT